MKILIVTDAWLPQLNGVVRTYQYLGQELEKLGHEVRIVGPDSFARRYPMPGYKEIELVWRPYNDLATMMREFMPDAIHIATEGPLGWAARKYCMRYDLKFTTCYHTQFPDYIAKRVCMFLPFLYKPVHAMGLAVIKKFHIPSSGMLITTDSMIKQLQEWGIKTPIYKFTRGIDTDLFHLADNNPSVFENLPKPIALYVGRIAVEKNIEKFLDMDWSGSKVVVGHGPDAEHLQKAYPGVVFTGKKTGKELADHYSNADLFVFPSRTDTFGIVLIEALACGLPIAAHDVIGPRDIVIDESLGCLDEDLSVAAKVAMTRGTREQRSRYVIENYTWEKATEQFLTAQQIIKKSKKKA